MPPVRLIFRLHNVLVMWIVDEKGGVIAPIALNFRSDLKIHICSFHFVRNYCFLFNFFADFASSIKIKCCVFASDIFSMLQTYLIIICLCEIFLFLLFFIYLLNFAINAGDQWMIFGSCEWFCDSSFWERFVLLDC